VLPLRDNVRTARLPVVTIALIALNAAVFFFTLGLGDRTVRLYDGSGTVRVSGFEVATIRYGFTPCTLDRCARPDRAEVLAPGRTDTSVAVRVARASVLLTLLTAMFLHGGWLHIIGNMLFLWIFGNNVEDRLGRPRFVVYYLVCGLAASLTQFAIDTGSDAPTIGASGAIAGVLGGYLLLYPRARVLTVVPLLLFFYVVEIPAVLVLLLWFGLQVLDGSAALAAPHQSFGVAYFAHIGGFVIGFLLLRPFLVGRRPVQPPRPALLA
jgi:rhomboid family protein